MDDEEENLCRYGTPLEPLEEDEIPSKKPIAIEDQIVTDANGRRRFHGAFTGGFSAGFWNTVGSLEGWKPQSFKSSRSEKAEQLAQKPTDFMDEEDLGEFGIASQRIQTTDDFTPQDKKDSLTSRKRKLQQYSTGSTIPGVPVLHQLIQPAKENAAIRILKKMGWKSGQGVGARQTRKEKLAATKRNAREQYVMKKYGCDMDPFNENKLSESLENDNDDDDDDIDDIENITFAPDDFDPYLYKIKNNKFGLGYSGLNPNSLSDSKEHVNLFGTALEVMTKDNKKISIRGQAFGVGALEEEDEDIYAVDDMTKYDFTLESKKRKVKDKRVNIHDENCIEGFCKAKEESSQKKVFTVILPPDCKPRNWAIRKSRFEPISEERIKIITEQNEYKRKGLGRHDIDPQERGTILGESVSDKTIISTKKEDKRKLYLKQINAKYNTDDADINKCNNNSVEEIVLDKKTRIENEKIQSEAQKLTESLPSLKPNIFRPFANDEVKQERYEKFINANLIDDDEITTFLNSIQPLSMSDWDREMEKKEFLQARKIYKPLKGIMSDRFVSEATILAEKENKKILPKIEKEKQEIVRTKVQWKPSTQLCKRFNVAEPFGGTMIEVKNAKKPKFSVFDYLETSINRKDNFVTPVIIPKKIEKPKEIISQHNIRTEIQEQEPTCSKNSESIAKISKLEDEKTNDNTNKNQIVITTQTNTKLKYQKPKTELEKKIEEMKNKYPSEKKDIFKSIFENSDDDDEENKKISDSEEKQKEIKQNELESTSSTAISKDIYASLTKSATELNILRNTSPPRGIFANLFTRKSEREAKSSTLTKPESSNKEIVEEKPLQIKNLDKEISLNDDK